MNTSDAIKRRTKDTPVTSTELTVDGINIWVILLVSRIINLFKWFIISLKGPV